MKIKALQWNIGGGYIREPEADPALPSSYTRDGLPSMVALLQEHQPDIITLQETHESSADTQAEVIAKSLGYDNWVNHTCADSHVAPGYKLGQAIISRYPITNQYFDLFSNPGLEVVHDGAVLESHDKGLTTCVVHLPQGVDLTVQTLQMFPLRKMGVELGSAQARQILSPIQRVMLKRTGMPLLLQGDFNINKGLLAADLPDLFEVPGTAEIPQETPTNTRGRAYDHIIFAGLRPLGPCVVVEEVLTDHFPLITEFELDN